MPKLSISVKEGNTAPRYPETTKLLTIDEAVITEQGMASGFPVVDFQMTDSEGNKYFIMTSGGIINGLSAAIKGVNLRIHGVAEEP